MKIKQLKVESIQELNITLTFQPNLILCFSSLDEESIQPFLIQLQNQYPNALLAGCSTGGDVLNTTINYSALSLTFVQFENAQIDVNGPISLSVLCVNPLFLINRISCLC